ncbi:orotidine-5'-phosphate decarboxylase [Pseudalkalibacillus hwajinpoensis]|uniref:orotidine-5'-phosphate decarboxylase n=1 Tax=Guptibacillus hwajinpoensis TaxID=208199 RepID=UPI001CD228C6|nr:orotidine-5'-phosphate decarboxylase [Pseudalkalibacillus hwajinpoensis]MCA0990165.1 orotidine-5'-phosphate decarboxylase [Pseudalkalibacillus hwajinpoensis]
MESSIILALDFSDKEELNEFLKQFEGEKLFVKVGMEAFYHYGPKLVDELKQRGHHVFLDLKLHDIPNTVNKAMKGLAGLGVDLINVHASGGSRMMQSAVEGLEAGTRGGQKRPLCIGVTQLTSTSEEMLRSELQIATDMKKSVVSLAELAKRSGLDGVVSSALEVPMIKEACGESFLTVTPGIRLEGDMAGDQNRVCSPKKARSLGSDFIVVGRSITGAKNPLAAYDILKSEWRNINEVNR